MGNSNISFKAVILTYCFSYLDSYGVDSTKYGVAHSDELWYLWNIYFGVYYVNNRTEVWYIED